MGSFVALGAFGAAGEMEGQTFGTYSEAVW